MMAVAPAENKEVDKQLKCQCKVYKSCLACFPLFACDSAESFPSAQDSVAVSAIDGVRNVQELQT